MREKPKDHGRLLHIAEAIDNIYTFLHEISVGVTLYYLT